MRDARTERVLNTLCFECASVIDTYCLPLGRQGYAQARSGGIIDSKTTCVECPIAVIRGERAHISNGKPNSVFTKQLMPGNECKSRLDSYDTWLPCFYCDHAELSNVGTEDETVTLVDLEYCGKFCIAKTIRDAIEEDEAEARMS